MRYIQNVRRYNEADKATGEEPCQAKIFDILTGSIWQLPQFHNDQTILGYSNGLFLVEDTRTRLRTYL